jgi:hypothetical protein
MKNIIFLLLIFSAFKASSQESDFAISQPLISFLQDAKNICEAKIILLVKLQNAGVDTIKDDNLKAKQRLNNLKDDKPCFEHYLEVKRLTDKLITQLQADLLLTNRKKILIRINTQLTDSSNYYSKLVLAIREEIAALSGCNTVGKSGFAPSDVTGILTLIVNTIISSRDFRAQQIKSVNELLDKMRLTDINTLLAGGTSENSDKENDEPKSKEK